MRRESSRGVHQGQNSEAGFSVLEAMIAIAILAAGFLPLLILQTKFIEVSRKIEQVDTRSMASYQAAELIRITNLDKTLSGTREFPEFTIVWVAEPAIKDKYVRSSRGRPGRFTVSLYDVSIEITYALGQRETLQMRGLGWTETYEFGI